MANSIYLSVHICVCVYIYLYIFINHVFPDILGTHGLPTHWSSHEAELSLERMAFVLVFFLAMGQETHKWGNTLTGREQTHTCPLYFHNSKNWAGHRKLRFMPRDQVLCQSWVQFCCQKALILSKSKMQIGKENLLHILGSSSYCAWTLATIQSYNLLPQGWRFLFLVYI